MGEKRICKETMWSDLPEHLMERIMELLPVECLFRFRIVCENWNTVLSSEYFNSIARNSQPNLIVCSSNTQLPSLIYSFITQTWRTISLSFIPDNRGVNFRGSASGLLLIDIPIPQWFGYGFSILYVCNPLSKTCFRLPEMSCHASTVMGKAIFPVGNNTEEYNVMIVGRSLSNSVIVEVYNSVTKSWKVAGTIPEELNVVTRNQNMFFCKGCLFCMISNGGVMVYNIEHGTTTILAVPVANANNVLVCCKSCVVVVGLIEGNHSLQDVIIWELVFDCKWQEIGKMRRSVCDDFRRSSRSNRFECVGVGDKICFRGQESMEVLVYDVRARSWNWLRLPMFPQDLKCRVSLRTLPLQLAPNTKFS